MISHINGIVILANSLDGTISVMTQSGVGYCIFVGVKSSNAIQIGQSISLFIEAIVKEDSFNLYGFKNYEQQVMFNSLLKVSGVGAKVAINVLDNLSVQEITQAIIEENAAMFQKIGGLGEKVSTRIVAELKKEPAKNAKILALTKVGKASLSVITEQMQQTQGVEVQESISSTISVQDVTSALVNLGFEYNRSFAIASKVVKTSSTIEEAITEALRVVNQ
jgi:Holliday junction DNA helicase RuvA